MPRRHPNSITEEKPFTARTALILLLAVITAVAAGWLFHAGVHSIPLAVFTAGATFAGAWSFFDRLIT